MPGHCGRFEYREVPFTCPEGKPSGSCGVCGGFEACGAQLDMLAEQLLKELEDEES